MKRKVVTAYRCLTISYAVAVVLIGLLVNPVYLVLLTPFAFARPILRELRALKDLDERELAITYRSSHIAFSVYLTIATIIILKDGLLDRVPPSPELVLLLVIPVFVKLVTSTALNYSLKKAGLGIAWVSGAFWFLFALFSHGLTTAGLIESLIGLSIIAATLLSLKWRHVGGALLLFEGAAGAFLSLTSDWDPMMRILIASLFGLPLGLAGLFISTSRKEEKQ
jgi:hypothetical protein